MRIFSSVGCLLFLGRSALLNAASRDLHYESNPIDPFLFESFKHSKQFLLMDSHIYFSC